MRLTFSALLIAMLAACGQAGPLVRPGDIPRSPAVTPVEPKAAEPPAAATEPQPEKAPEAAVPAAPAN